MAGAMAGERGWRRVRRLVPVVQPAAGAEWSAPVPASSLWDVLAISAQLVTSAAVASRAARLTLSFGGSLVLTIPPAAVQAAGDTWRYAWYPHAAGAQVGTGLVVPIPQLRLETGWTIASSTELLDAGDQWSAVTLYVIETTLQRGDLMLDDVPAMLVELVGSSAAE